MVLEPGRARAAIGVGRILGAVAAGSLAWLLPVTAAEYLSDHLELLVSASQD
jgi:hypothetical protein